MKTYETSKYPIGKSSLGNNIYDAIIHDGHELISCLVQDGVALVSEKFGKVKRIALDTMIQEDGLFQMMEDLEAHDKKMQSWRNAGE